VYGPVRTVVWQGSVGDRRPYADQWYTTGTKLLAVAWQPLLKAH
jgi:hypothetical protein